MTLGHANVATTSGYLHARPDTSSGLKLNEGIFSLKRDGYLELPPRRLWSIASMAKLPRTSTAMKAIIPAHPASCSRAPSQTAKTTLARAAP